VSADEAPKAGRREWIGLAVIALPCLLYSMDLTVLELAVPKLSADLEPTSSQLLWIIDIYGAFVLDPDGNNIEAVCHGPEQEV
jgi:DHA2 family multidrug resistance protein-like MFS transporter